MTDAALSYHNVRKSYGRTRALDGLTFRVPTGSMCGLVGPNGAGKSTAFALAGGLMPTDSGVVRVLGHRGYDVRAHRTRVGIMPQDADLNPYTPVAKLLTYYARLQGMSVAEAKKDASRVLEWVELQDRASWRIRQLSHGMRRRVCLAQALLGSPELIILDEPLSGLDPKLAYEIKSLFKELGAKSTMLISSHVLADLEMICDEVVFMLDGKCTHQARMEDTVRRDGHLRVRMRGDKPPIDELKDELPNCSFEYEGDWLIVNSESHSLELNRRVLSLLLNNGADISDVRSSESLEEAYIRKRSV